MKQAIAFASGAAAVILVLLIVRAKDSAVASNSSAQSNQVIQHSLENCIVKLPEQLDFAGESVPLDQPDVAERLDRELHVNVYWHSSTIQILKLANRWFPVIEEILAENNVPDDFKYLCVAESALRNAVSPAGATGFWQFLSSTGKSYGLEIYSEVDERYHVEKATVAACKYLKSAFARYNNWTLAAAAYNAGSGGVSGRMETQKVKSYYDLLLHNETSRYIFRVLAFKLILSNPDNYGFCFDEEDLYQPLPTRKVEVKETIPDLASWAISKGSNYKTLKFHNPWLRGNTLTVKSKTYEIALPQ